MTIKSISDAKYKKYRVKVLLEKSTERDLDILEGMMRRLEEQREQANTPHTLLFFKPRPPAKKRGRPRKPKP